MGRGGGFGTGPVRATVKQQAVLIETWKTIICVL
jgi:hypothetical protein